MEIKTEFNNGEMVSLKHDKDRMPRQIVGINIRGDKGQQHSYQLQSGRDDSWHFAFEIERINEINKKVGF